MKIAGILKASLIDYPGKTSAVCFLGGCNFHCGYCHNPEIVHCSKSRINDEELFHFLEKRRRFLDAVCISGGEPTLQEELYFFASRIKEMGYFIKLDTNGSNPELLKLLAKNNLLDYVAMDVKAPLNRYNDVVCVKADQSAIRESMDFLLAGSIPYEFRTTICKELLTFEDLTIMSDELSGAKRWYLQTFQKQGDLLNASASFSAYSEEEMKHFAMKLNEMMKIKLCAEGAATAREGSTCVSVR